MSLNFDIKEANINLEKMLQQVRQGQETIITENGVAVARLVPCPSPPHSRKTFAEIKQILIAQKQVIQEKYHVSELRIFGSYVRGEDTEDSDVDILIDYDEAPTLIELIELEYYLSDLLGIKVDVVTKNSLKPPIKERILLEAVTI
jgi:uncharacterized protein